MSRTGKQREVRHWKTYVDEARSTFCDVDLGDGGDIIRVYIPTADTIKALRGIGADDVWAQIDMLFGSEAERVQAAIADEPITAASALVDVVMADLGMMEPNPGN